jgi:Gnt-I system low-affinity gluconate transporter
MKFSDRALAPAGLIIPVTGAGGVFKQILIESRAIITSLILYFFFSS